MEKWGRNASGGRWVAAWLLLGLLVAAPALGEGVNVKLLKPSNAAVGLKVFKASDPPPLDRDKMLALLERALAESDAPDATIVRAEGNEVVVSGDSGEATLQYDEAAHAWSGSVWVVALPL